MYCWKRAAVHLFRVAVTKRKINYMIHVVFEQFETWWQCLALVLFSAQDYHHHRWDWRQDMTSRLSSSDHLWWSSADCCEPHVLCLCAMKVLALFFRYVFEEDFLSSSEGEKKGWVADIKKLARVAGCKIHVCSSPVGVKACSLIWHRKLALWAVGIRYTKHAFNFGPFISM